MGCGGKHLSDLVLVSNSHRAASIPRRKIEDLLSETKEDVAGLPFDQALLDQLPRRSAMAIASRWWRVRARSVRASVSAALIN